MQPEIFSPIDLPCGRTIRNRLVKVAMYEHLATLLGGPPNHYHYSLYSKWSHFDWGMIITGNVQVSPTHLSLGRDVVLPPNLSDDSLAPFKKLARAIHGDAAGTQKDVLAVMQLSHAGRQSSNFLGGRPSFQPPLAPSAIPVRGKNQGLLSHALHALTFQTPTPMSTTDIDEVVEDFVRGAKVAHLSGFDGVQLHSAHGYLLAQFISPKSNTRTDEYSSSHDDALRLLHRISTAIRAAVPKTFILGVKLNAADYVISDTDKAGTKDEQRVLSHVRSIASWGLVDFLEVSGGDYEKPDFSNTVTSPRQALFSQFSQAARETLESLEKASAHPPPLILLTGGMKTPEILHTALSAKHAHLLGIGRGSILCPDLPALLEGVDASSPDDSWSMTFRPEPGLRSYIWLTKFLPSIPLIGAGINMAWYTVAIRRLATLPSPSTLKRKMKLGPDYNVGPLGALVWMWVWADDPFWWIFLLVAAAMTIGAVAVLVVSAGRYQYVN